MVELVYICTVPDSIHKPHVAILITVNLNNHL